MRESNPRIRPEKPARTANSLKRDVTLIICIPVEGPVSDIDGLRSRSILIDSQDMAPANSMPWGVRRDSNPLTSGSQPDSSTTSESYTVRDIGFEPIKSAWKAGMLPITSIPHKTVDSIFTGVEPVSLTRYQIGTIYTERSVWESNPSRVHTTDECYRNTYRP